MLRAFIITGPQSSGNHVVSDIFLKSGCYGTLGGDQGLGRMVKDKISPVVWHGSMPKGGLHVQKLTNGDEYTLDRPCWHHVGDRVESLREAGYDVTVVVPMRELLAMARSQTKYVEIPTLNDAICEIKQAYKRIFTTMPDDADFVVVPYEALVFQKEKTIKALSQMVGLELSTDIEITDENAKWYGV